VRVVRDDIGAVTIEGLTPSQFAFIVGVVGASNALLGFEGEISRRPLIPTARELYPELRRHAAQHGLLAHVDAVISSQRRWKAQTARGRRLNADPALDVQGLLDHGVRRFRNLLVPGRVRMVAVIREEVRLVVRVVRSFERGA